MLATVRVGRRWSSLAGAVLLLAPASLHFGLKGSGGSTNNATSGRTKLIREGSNCSPNDPSRGTGRDRSKPSTSATAAPTRRTPRRPSHTIPVTVAAEQGILGLGVYLALLVGAFVVLFRGAGRSPPRIAVAACFAALVLHTWTYADFLEDPFTWTLLAIGVALVAAERSGRGHEPAQAATASSV